MKPPSERLGVAQLVGELGADNDFEIRDIEDRGFMSDDRAAKSAIECGYLSPLIGSGRAVTCAIYARK